MSFKTMPSTTTQNKKSVSLSASALPLVSVAWQLTSFAELSPYQIYTIIQAREQVFVKDQHCIYIDADGLDFEAMHLSAYNDDANTNTDNNDNPQLLAYCRILVPSTAQGYPRIGRVLVLADYRGHGLARELMIQAIEYCHNQFPKQPIHISAQTYLIEFYQSLGFVCEGDVYSEEGIEHMHMVLPAP
ncbi:GNAT family N-acetyltransferase [Psychrobacter frigidicola]|uniref:GNAT family N-acetyltransferase n=1 Tax=Psychrobacter frigidicola TaxID=45611 RepID=A0A5C7A3X9_9GAMM|nr:GNAT family N-acetyltransferase [Psychrobacter frigidicola]TXD97798.1 GNAT family N-acetyltransferase [Psychrobacter frigidicola]